MTSLFVDTTFGLTVGVLDDLKKWINLTIVDSNQGSSLIHKMIYDELKSAGLDIKALDNCYFISGPGSYTGMRVSGGIEQIFSWQGLKTNTFYHFQIPKILGHTKGIWHCSAFKNEIFAFEWTEKHESKHILSNEDFAQALAKWKSLGYEIFDIEDVKKMIKTKSELLFSTIEKLGMKEEIFYFRPLDKEFQKKSSV